MRLGRLRAMGDLAEVRGEQLRFSDQEAALLLNEVHGLDLDATEIATVQARIEGWVAGLNLAALSLKRGPDRGRVSMRCRPTTASWSITCGTRWCWHSRGRCAIS